MAEGAAVDTDVLLKASAYRTGPELVNALEAFGEPSALGLTHLIARGQLCRMRGLRDVDGADQALSALLRQLGRLEPEEEEVLTAAEFAALAQERGLPLDRGEAQLAAIVISRGLPLLLTGDKRAIAAIADLFEMAEVRTSLVGRLGCFEQALGAVCSRIGEESLRERVCAEPDIDGAMRLACSCGSDLWRPEQLHEAFESYVSAIRAQVGNLLADGSALV